MSIKIIDLFERELLAWSPKNSLACFAWLTGCPRDLVSSNTASLLPCYLIATGLLVSRTCLSKKVKISGETEHLFRKAVMVLKNSFRISILNLNKTIQHLASRLDEKYILNLSGRQVWGDMNGSVLGRVGADADE